MHQKSCFTGFIVAVLILGLSTVHASVDAVQTDFDDEILNLHRVPSSIEIGAFSTKSSQPDTILYDDGIPAYYISADSIWTDVRFTPLADFNLLAIYIVVYNPQNNMFQGCSLFVVPDDGTGAPDWPNRVWVGNIPPPLANMTWIQFDLAGPIYFAAGQDFHIAYGPAPGGAGSWWPLFDDSTTTQRTYVSSTNGQTWVNMTNVDAFIRAGGWYTVVSPCTVAVGDGQGAPGDTVTIDISLNCQHPATFLEFYISENPDPLNYLRPINMGPTGRATTVTAIAFMPGADSTYGMIGTFPWEPIPPGQGPVVYLSYEIDTLTQPGAYDLALSNVVLMGTVSKGTETLSVHTENGQLTVAGPVEAVKLNEILYRPGVAGTGVPQYSIEWIEIFNAGTDTQNLTGWTIAGRDGIATVTLPAWDLPPRGYLTVHFGIGTNDSDFSDNDGHFWTGDTTEAFNDIEDECALYWGSPSSATIVDFVSWCADGDYLPGTAHDHAVAAGMWSSGAYINTESLKPVDTMGRYFNGFDNDIPEDWRIYDWRDYVIIGISQPENPIQLVPEKYLIIDDATPTFDWADAPGIDFYQLQVDNDEDFSSPEINDSTLTTSEFTPSIPLGSELYFFRIRGIKGGMETHWSAVWVFVIDASKSLIERSSNKILSCPFKWQRKDTKLLCIYDASWGNPQRPGCPEIGAHRWDTAHPDGPPPRDCPHCWMYCVRASIAMVNGRYGGDLSQDRISYYMFWKKVPGSQVAGGADGGENYPEGDLWHNRGPAYPLPVFPVGSYTSGTNQTKDGLSWALNGAAIDVKTPATTPAPHNRFTFAEMQNWVNSLDCFMAMIPGHAVVVEGYAELSTPRGRLIQALYVHDPARGSFRRKIYAWRVPAPPPADRRAWGHEFTHVFLQPTTGVAARKQEASVTKDTDKDGVMDFDEQNRFCSVFNDMDKDTDDDEVLDKQDIRNYTFHDTYHALHDNDPLNFPDIDGDGLRAECDCDTDNDSDFDGGEDIDGNGHNPVGGMETCMFDNADFEIWVSVMTYPCPYILCREHAYLFGQTFHANSWYPYEVRPCLSLTDSMGLGRTGIVTTDANGIIHPTYIGCYPSGCYRVVVDVLRDHHYSEPDNWDPWTDFIVGPHIKLVYKLSYDEYEPYYLWYYTSVLDELGLEYEINIIPPEYPGPDYPTLKNYPVVIWITGDNYYSTVLPEDAVNLMAYLDNGGKLFITGQDIGYDIFWDYESPDLDTLPQKFFKDYLYAEFIRDIVKLFGLNGVPGTFFEPFDTLRIMGGDGANNQYYADEIRPIETEIVSMSLASYDTSITGWIEPPEASKRRYSALNSRTSLPTSDTLVGAIAVDNGVYKAVYFAFGFEGIDNQIDRVNVMDAVLNWLVPPPVGVCTLQVADTAGAPGSSNNPMDIELNNSIGVGGAEFTLAFDGTILTADSAKTTSRSSHMTFSYSSGLDSIKVIMFSMIGDSISSGTGPIATVFFSVDTNAASNDSTPVRLKDVVMSDPGANPIAVVTEDGWFSFRGMKCDVNGDDDINVLDIVRMVNIILGKPPSPTSYESWAADCNDDGDINVIDIVCCVNRIFGDLGMRDKKGHSFAKLEIPEIDVQEQELNEIPILVDANVPIAGAQLKLSYDANKLSLGTPQLTARSANMTITSHVKANQLIILIYSETGKVIPAGAGSIVSIPFAVAEKAQGEYCLSVDEVVLAGSDGQPIDVETPRIALRLGQPLPEDYKLLQNLPNPCHVGTAIAYHLPKISRVILKIYNVSGQLVKTLVDENQNAGYYMVRWDNKDESNEPVSSGVYFYQIKAGEFTAIKKLVVLR